MRQETERIWSPLNVRIAWRDSIEAGSPPAPSGLIVMLEENAYPAEPVRGAPVLAALNQPADACGQGVAHVWVRQVEDHTALVRRGDHAYTTLPSTLADALLGRALGRTLAHEIGHYLLGTGTHSAHGLMRAQFTPEDLLQEATRLLYGLDARQRSALLACRADGVL